MEDLDRGQQIGLLDNQRRREANDGFMRLLGENSAPQHGETHILCVGARGIEFDSCPKPFAANLDDGGMVDAGKRGEQGFPQDAAPQGEILVLENVDRLARDRRGKRIAAKGRAMATGIEDVHDGAPRDKRGDGHQAAAERLANDETVGLGVLVFKTEVSPGAPEARLDLVENQQYARFPMVFRGRFQVVGCGAFRLDFDGGLGGEARRRHPSYSVFADVVAFPNLPFRLFAASSDLVEIVIRNMTPFLPDLALRLPIPCSILSGNVLQSLGEHIATLNVDGRIVFQLGFANAPASAGTQADAWRLQMKRTSPARDLPTRDREVWA